MKLYTMFGQRTESYEGEYAPEVLLCRTEFDVDENPDGFAEACAEERKKAEKEFSSVRVLAIEVDGEKIARLLNKTPVVKGTVAVIDGDAES